LQNIYNGEKSKVIGLFMSSDM